MKRRPLRIEHLWLGLPIFVLAWKAFLFPLPTLDFWWHLKLGQIIATTGSIPRTDLFSFTAAGQPFIAQNWLAELIYYGAYAIGGFPLLLLLNVTLLVLAYLPIYALCREAGVRTAAAATMLAVSGTICYIRPQVFSFLMFSLCYWILARHRSGSPRVLWILPPLTALWVNLHGAFVLGLGLVSLYLASESLRRLIHGPRTDVLTAAGLGKVALILALCLIATLVNPEGYKVYDYVRVVMTDAASQELVSEWQPPRIDDALGVLVLYLPLFLGLVIFTYAKTKPDLTEMALFAAFALLGLKSLRNGVWFGMIAAPILARYFPLLNFDRLLPLRRFGIVDRLAQWLDPQPDAKPAYGGINMILASVAIVLLALQSPWIRPQLYKSSLMDQRTPVAAADFIDAQNLRGNIFHPQIFGDYLIWRLWPEQRTFLDGRVHLFGMDVVRQYQRVFDDSNWEAVLARWDIRYLWLSADPQDAKSRRLIQAARDSGRWKTLFEDNASILFEKAGAPGFSRQATLSTPSQ